MAKETEIKSHKMQRNLMHELNNNKKKSLSKSNSNNNCQQRYMKYSN